MAAGVAAVAALVLLAGRLPGDAEPGGDLRPPDAHVYGLVDQRCEFRLDFLLRDSGLPDLLKYPRGNCRILPLRWARWWRRCSTHRG